jgi:hypothetical protein
MRCSSAVTFALALLVGCTSSSPGNDIDGGPGGGGTGEAVDGRSGGGGAPACDPECSGGTVCVDGACAAAITGVPGIDGVLLGDPSAFDTQILISQNPDLSWRPSTIYKWRDFVQAVASMHLSGVGDLQLWLGDPGADASTRTRQALANLAAFLAQSMKETIRYDACDENNWDNTNGYAISNACGQLGQSYADYDCAMACPRAPQMQTHAVTNAAWYGAPGPLFCAPDSALQAAGLSSDGRTGRWDYNHDCWPYPATEPNFTPADGPPQSRAECQVYTGQKGGRYVWDGSGGSVEGCCWWGRGVIQTTGRCNFGILNHHLGRTHLDPAQFPAPAKALYPDIDFCQDPEVICRSAEHPELKWVAGLFYWMSSVQEYERDGWRYRDQLRAFVDGGMSDDAFIDAVSGIVNRGCHNPPCATGPVDGAAERRENFHKVLRVMGLE